MSCLLHPHFRTGEATTFGESALQKNIENVDDVSGYVCKKACKKLLHSENVPTNLLARKGRYGPITTTTCGIRPAYNDQCQVF